jgi:hypothetical protein
LSKSLASIARRKLSIIWDSANPSPGVMSPPPTASPTAFIAPRISAALSIGGGESSTERSRRDGAEAEPQCRRIAGEGELDRLAGQRRCFVIEQQLGRRSRPVRRVARPAGRISGLPFRKRSTSTPFSCCCCFLQRNISHRSISIGHLGIHRHPLPGMDAM